MGLTPHKFFKVPSQQKSYLQERGAMASQRKLPACSFLDCSNSNTDVSKITCLLALNQAQKTTLSLPIFDPDLLIEAQKETHSSWV